MKIHPALAFFSTIVLCMVWLGLLVVIARFGAVLPIAQVLVPISVVTLAGAFQFFATRGLVLTKLRRGVQVLVASVLAPNIAYSILYFGSAVVLGNGG